MIRQLTRVFWNFGVPFTLLYLLAGCSREQKVELVNAVGIVTIDGQPAENILVQFYPDVAPGRRLPMSTGISGSDGCFHLQTSDGRPGAVVGTFKVTIVDLNELESERSTRDGEGGRDESASNASVKNPNRVPSKFSTISPNSLTAEIKEGGDYITLDVRG